MNYKLSEKILAEIKKANKILINCHRNPDPDSVGSALSMYSVLKSMHKEVRIVCSTKVDESCSYLNNYEVIETLDFSSINFLEYGLFISLDSSSWDFATGMKKTIKPPIQIINIDHHKTNEKYGNINLVDSNLVSSAELIYLIFEDWGVEIDKEVATMLLAGIIGDSGAFRYPGVTAKTLSIAQGLMEKGADKDKIVFNDFFSYDFSYFKFWGEALSRTQFDKENNFVWTAIPHEVYKSFGAIKSFKESTASNFFQSVKGSDFGIVMVEEEKNKLNVSLRSRTGLDVSKIAVELGGGGHRYASGGGIHGLPFDQAVEEVLEIARKHANKKS